MNTKAQYDKFIEILLIVYLFIGMMSYPIFRYSRYVISLIMQLHILVNCRELRVDSKKSIIPFISYFLIFLIGIAFLYLDVSIVNWINRIFPLLSIFGLGVFVFYKEKVRFNSVLNTVIKLYGWLAIVIIFDAICFKISGVGIWKPIAYVTYRFKGPFYDCNYMGMLYAFLILLCWFRCRKTRKTVFTIILFLGVLYLSGSWSAIIICASVLVLSSVFRFKHLCIIQMAVLLSYYLISLLIVNNKLYVESEFVDFLGNILPFDSESLSIKFGSFLIRIETQLSAIQLSMKQLIGYGPLTILQYFSHDVHNSYVAILFECGLMGFILLLINMPWRVKNKLISSTALFCILSALVLDIHYTIIYSFFLLIVVFQCQENSEKYEKIAVGNSLSISRPDYKIKED